MTHNPSQKFSTKVTLFQLSSFPIATVSTAQQHLMLLMCSTVNILSESACCLGLQRITGYI